MLLHLWPRLVSPRLHLRVGCGVDEEKGMKKENKNAQKVVEAKA
jgi:hypothetical protein